MERVVDEPRVMSEQELDQLWGTGVTTEPGRANGGGSADGGDGGDGGDVVLRADPAITTLLDFHYQRHYTAERGQHGKRPGQVGQQSAADIPPHVAERAQAIGSDV